MSWEALLPWLGTAVAVLTLVGSWVRFLRVERPTAQLAETVASETQRNKLMDQVLTSASFLGERMPELEKENTACREQVLILQERITACNERISAMEGLAAEAVRALAVKHAEEVAALNAVVARLTLRLTAYESAPVGASTP